MVMQNTKLKKRLDNVSRAFPSDKILNRNSSKPSEIAKYYRKNRLAYRLFNSHEGFVHMAISSGDDFSTDDFYRQAVIVDQAIKSIDARKVLELAPGKAATIRYLAKQNPRVEFYGLDLEHGQLNLKQKIKNVHLSYGDFHNLSDYRDGTLDVVYVIEALCHASDKRKVISEASRVLRKGGLLIVIDGYFKAELAKLSDEEKIASELVVKSMMVTDKGQSYKYFTKLLAANGFRVKESRDYTNNILPSLYRLERKAKKLIENPRLAKLITALTGDIVTANAVAGYLMPTCVEGRLFEYRYTLAEKK